MTAGEIEERILELDRQLVNLSRSDCKLPIVIVGCASVILLGAVPAGRTTTYIDVLEAPFEAVSLMGSLDMNNAASTFSFRMPSGWRARSSKINLETEVFDVVLLTRVNLAAMKLVSGRERDIGDVAFMVEKCPSLLDGLRSLLENPLELEINLDEEDWDAVESRFRSICDEMEHDRTLGNRPGYGGAESSHGRSARPA